MFQWVSLSGAWDEETDSVGSYKVVALIRRRDSSVLHPKVGVKRLVSTTEHPFYTREWDWVEAGELRLGEHVRRLDGGYGEVVEVRSVQHQQRMYNLTVEEVHTFFVGDGEWLVHNAERNPINCGFAGKVFEMKDSALKAKYPNGVRFTPDGYPDFSPYAIATVKIRMAGNRTTDFALANEKANLKPPRGYTWHHHQDRITTQLVPSDLHDAVRHTGGVSIIKHQGPLP